TRRTLLARAPCPGYSQPRPTTREETAVRESATVLSRRHVLLAAAAAAPYVFAGTAGAEEEKRKGRVKQSVVFWCFNSAGDKWDVDKTCRVAKELGCTSVEIVPPEDWPTLKKYGLTCAIAPNGMPGAPFMKGLNNPRYQEEVIARTGKTIDACAEAGVP